MPFTVERLPNEPIIVVTFTGSITAEIVGENTGLGTVNYVTRTFWQNHDFHRRAALNTTFRETGVAAIQYPSGEYLIFSGLRGASQRPDRAG